MEALLFLGCTVPVRNLNYEMSARLVAERLGITFRDLEGFGCCGYPLKSLSSFDALVIAARSLSMAEREDLPLCALCNACAGMLSEAAHVLDHNAELRSSVNERLASVGLAYNGPVKVSHFMRTLWEHAGEDVVRRAVTKPLTGVRLAPHYGCHYLKPSELTHGFDSPDDPHTMTQLIRATGAEAVDYPSLKDCCGGGVLGASEATANLMAAGKLKDVQKSGAHALVVVCPFCNVMYEGRQKQIGRAIDMDLRIPVVYYPQVLGLALGLSSQALGFRLNRAKPTELLKIVEG